MLDYPAAHSKAKLAASLATQTLSNSLPASKNKQSSPAATQTAEHAAIISRRGWETALAPARQVPMQGFVMWMSGSSLHVVSLVSLAMLVISSIRGLASTNRTFAPLHTANSQNNTNVDLSFPIIVYALGQLALLGLAFYKANSVGLLPTSSSDWLAFVQPRVPLEYSDIQLSL